MKARGVRIRVSHGSDEVVGPAETPQQSLDVNGEVLVVLLNQDNDRSCKKLQTLIGSIDRKQRPQDLILIRSNVADRPLEVEGNH